ncbi:hypothetical protein Tco_0178805 [Tanacetum coccineum]
MLEDFSSNSKGKRTYAYTILFLELTTLNLSCLLEEQLLEPALNLTVHCCGREFRVLNFMIKGQLYQSFSAPNSESFPLGLKDVPALKLRVPALTSRVCATYHIG